MGKSNSKSKKYRINFFDVIVVVLVLALAIGFFIWRSGKATEEKTTVYYTVEFTNMTPLSAEHIQPGDELIDAYKKFNVGTVKEVELVPAYINPYDPVSDTFILTFTPAKTNARLRMEAVCTENEKEIVIDSGFVLRVGTSISFKGPGYASKGIIVNIERGDEA